jgi:hypothetical protein
MPASRSVVSMQLRELGDFSTPSRPALRAASGRPPARQRHGGHRGAGLTLEPGASQSSPEPCPLVRAWSALGPRSIGTRWSSTGTNGQPRYDRIAGQAPIGAPASDGEGRRRWVRIPPPPRHRPAVSVSLRS